jgi:hypothetical protein
MGHLKIDELAHWDYFRAVMYTRIEEALTGKSLKGEGVEFGGTNGVIQGLLPEVKWEVRNPPQFDVTNPQSYERNWDVIVADQVLEHTARPWEAIRLIGEHTNKLAIITVPFLIGLHPAPHDYWRMTPRTIDDLSKPYFPSRKIDSWGTSKANWWHSIYNRTCHIWENVPRAEVEAELTKNEPKKPFVIWAILEK